MNFKLRPSEGSPKIALLREPTVSDKTNFAYQQSLASVIFNDWRAGFYTE